MRGIISLLLLVSFGGWAGQLTIAYRNHADDLIAPSKEVIDAAIARVAPGIGTEWKLVPLERARYMMEAGKLDADFGRTLLAYQDTEEVVLPSSPVFSAHYYLFYRKGEAVQRLEQWKAEKVVAVRGDKQVESLGLNVHWVNSKEAGMKMVLHERAFAFLSFSGAKKLLDWEEYSELAVSDDPIFSVSVYVAFHQRHKALAERLGPVFRQMAEEGTTISIYGKYGFSILP